MLLQCHHLSTSEMGRASHFSAVGRNLNLLVLLTVLCHQSSISYWYSFYRHIIVIINVDLSLSLCWIKICCSNIFPLFVRYLLTNIFCNKLTLFIWCLETYLLQQNIQLGRNRFVYFRGQKKKKVNCICHRLFILRFEDFYTLIINLLVMVR